MTPEETTNLPAAIEPTARHAISALTDLLASEDLGTQGAAFAVLYAIQLDVNRKLRDPKLAIAEAMDREGITRLGPIRLKYATKATVYVCNEPGNWTDAGVQDALAELAGDPRYAPFIAEVPGHREVIPQAIAQAMHLGDSNARWLFDEMTRRGWRRTVEGRPTIEVDPVKPKDPAR